MAGYFFDTSALVKLYRAEAGTPAVDQIANAADSRIRISRLTVAEMTSAFAIKVRTKSISREDAGLCLSQFINDVTIGKMEVFSIGEPEFSAAELLVERYAFNLRLRTLDAIQLAMALRLRNHNLIDYLVSADTIFCEIARLEGLAVVNPEYA